jgi:site-specific DNA-methyltransferase (cytosine-N4-specific)
LTYLKALHPYPAMIADDLAASLAERFIDVGSLVLDPFCGTGRTLFAAAERGGKCIGVDVNPLAVLIANAKAGGANIEVIDYLLAGLSRDGCRGVAARVDLEPGRRVSWFNEDARRELSQIIGWINRQKLARPELFLIATLLSATVRDVSLCRKKQWKLHRMNEVKRRAYHRSAWRIFQRKLTSVAKELRNARQPAGRVEAVQGDARHLPSILPLAWRERVDVVFTSPPYGDSRTTVGYGGVSGICLGVVRNIQGLENIFMTGGEIDRRCLGGDSLASRERL